MSNYVTTKDVLESAKKYGKDKVLTWSPDSFRDNKQNKKNAKTAFDCTWVNIKFKNSKGEEMPLRLKFNRVLTASAAKIPSSSDENNLKNLVINFRKFQLEEVNNGDYAPKELQDESAQNAENKRAKEALESYLEATNEFNDVMEIIDLSYQRITDELKAAKTLGFTLRKDTKSFKTNDSVTVYQIRQLTRTDQDDPNGEEIALEFPLTRIKLNLNKEQQVGIEFWNRDITGFVFQPNVYDSRKMTAKNNYEPVLAKVKTNGKLEGLNAKNAGSFITYKSLVGGVIEFRSIIVSKFGISLENKFYDLYVRRHKSASMEPAFSPSDLKDMCGDNEEGEESDVEVVTEALADAEVDVKSGSDLEGGSENESEVEAKDEDEADEIEDSDLDA